jgi:hypothetical protein
MLKEEKKEMITEKLLVMLLDYSKEILECSELMLKKDYQLLKKLNEKIKNILFDYF